MVLSQRIHEAFKGTVERITGPRTVSAFKEKGVLSVSEFILAGDNLVSKCPTWSWESGEPSKRKSYLPPEKQYLITRNVPCLRRAASVEEEYEAAGGEVLLDNEDNDGWLATHDKSDVEENLPSMETLEIRQNAVRSIPSYFGVGEDEEDIPDMADYEEADNLVETDAVSAEKLI
ncbi:hypothetical protein Gohar_007189 [Gossypium harknessii]|uniref:Autophagy-related protein 3 n=1 Tax=Gossypium harknessii TaxID=34285 RepID=A0A7J9GFR8_9ROSI|nr:hypothetical protein [Gossypium harknessii]